MRNPFILSVILLMVITGAISCGKKDSGDKGIKKEFGVIAEIRRSDKNKPAEQQTANVPLPAKTERLRIDEVKIVPRNLTATSSLSVKTKIFPSENRDFELRYIFWRNAEKIKEGNENALPSQMFKKGDFVYVDAIIQRNEKEISRRRSPMTRILNTSPEIKGIEFPDIRGPGIYNLRINARDADQDSLVYSLEGDGLPEWMSINSETGIIRIELGENPLEKVKFFVKVRDDDGGEVKQEINLTFRQPEKKESSRGS